MLLGVPARAFAKADDSTALTWTEQGAYLDGIDGADVPVLRKEGGRKRVLGVEDWAEILRLRRADQMSISEIARVLRVSRNTVRSALARDGAPKYERAPAGSVLDRSSHRPDPKGGGLRS